jgi:hypothetical protein
MEHIAQFSPCRNWRYTLIRQWADGEDLVAFLMFNPSTADETQDDPTIRKCIRFAMRWGYGRLVILNLFAIRGTDPRKVANVNDPVGPLNNYWILKSVEPAREIICAWGCGQHMKRADLAARPVRYSALSRKSIRMCRYAALDCVRMGTHGIR